MLKGDYFIGPTVSDIALTKFKRKRRGSEKKEGVRVVLGTSHRERGGRS